MQNRLSTSSSSSSSEVSVFKRRERVRLTSTKRKRRMALILFCIFVFVQYESVRTTSISTIYKCWSNVTCGCSYNDAILTKIIGGEPAGIDTWPWIVSIRVWNNHICGGSLISSTLVLTAAHCLVSVTTKSSLSITYGSKYLSIVNQRRSIADVYLHRDYDAERYIHDIALLRLSLAITINDRNSMAFICLPSSIGESYPPSNRSVVAIGWGVLASDAKISSNVLQQVTLNTIATRTASCQRTIYDRQAQFCAGVKEGGKGKRCNEKINHFT